MEKSGNVDASGEKEANLKADEETAEVKKARAEGKAEGKDEAKKECKTESIKCVLNWLDRKWPYFFRVVMAGLIVICIGKPLTNNFNRFLDPTDIKEFVSVTVIEKATPQKQIAKDTSRGASEGDQSVIETARESSSAPRVWVYGLRIFGLLAALGGVLWAVVALCRE